MPKKPASKGRVLEVNTVVPIEPMTPKADPPSKVLTVRLPTPIVDALNKHKQEKNVEMSAIVRPILEKVLAPAETPLIENAKGQAESTTPGSAIDESNSLVRLFPWMPSYWESAKSA